ncbi:MAG: hypothetical protein LBU41_06015 [Clostridiales Family XIII bacterium]|jgi:tetratricopeptide (TPR) repeat protein|nr:hypothetical protein [Clostridiales Family XIII bacterium]
MTNQKDDYLKSDLATREIARKRPRSEWVFAERANRISEWLIDKMDPFIFDEFSEAYLASAKLETLMTNIPVPLRKEDIVAFGSKDGLDIRLICENMAKIIGIDPTFPYTTAYTEFILRFLGKKAHELFVKAGGFEADNEDLDGACIHFRAALVIKPDDRDAMFGYARICRAMYNTSTNEKYVGSFKAESLTYFELLTELYPQFADGWYYLGYIYLNMGLYMKANLSWTRFVLRSNKVKEKKEIQQRLEQLTVPIEIEKGCNAVLAERWYEGLSVLLPFTETVYKDWWPLWYYIGLARLGDGRKEEAKENFIRVLRLNGTQRDTIRALIEIYKEEGDEAMSSKYEDKLTLLNAENAANE